MIKAIKDGVTGKSLRDNDTLEVPIIEIIPSESELMDGIEHVLRNYPSCQAVLVRVSWDVCFGQELACGKSYDGVL